MKFKILVIIETIVLAFFVTLSIIRTGEAEKQLLRAEQLAQEAVKLTEAAESEAERAERAAADAVKAQAALEDCKSGT